MYQLKVSMTYSEEGKKDNTIISVERNIESYDDLRVEQKALHQHLTKFYEDAGELVSRNKKEKAKG